MQCLYVPVHESKSWAILGRVGAVNLVQLVCAEGAMYVVERKPLNISPELLKQQHQQPIRSCKLVVQHCGTHCCNNMHPW